MNDPHVEKLYYRFISENPTVLFENAQPLTISLGSFDVEIKDSVLVAIPQEHYSDEERAKEAFEPLLHSWESSSFLSTSKFRIRFKFDQSNVIDRNPTPGKVTLYATGITSTLTFGTPTLTLRVSKYPEPDLNFVASPLTDELIFRLKQYKDGRQTLPHVAYYILERLEKEFGGTKAKRRKELSKILNIDDDVLDKIGRFSNKPDARIGRHASSIDAPLSNNELNWLDQAVFRLVKRAGEINSGSKILPAINMSDFPKL
jgi:hypothetical protein